MPNFDSLEFLNLNSLRNYPLKEGVTRLSTDLSFAIPNDFIADFQFAGTNDITKRFYISKIANFEDTVLIEVSDDDNVLACIFTIVTAGHITYKKYYAIASDAYVGANAVMTVFSLDELKKQPAGIFLFNLAGAEFETRTILPAIAGVTRITFANASGSSFTLTGDVKIEARTNVKFKLGINNTVIIDAGDNLGLNEICNNEKGCIKTINNIPPDENGNFTLDFSDCATLTPILANTGLLLQDVCCKPCVGCNDIATLTERLITVEDTLIQVRQYYTDLRKLFDDFKLTTTYTCDCPPES